MEKKKKGYIMKIKKPKKNPNPMAKDLRQSKYRQQVVLPKKGKGSKYNRTQENTNAIKEDRSE